jgi:hypothetical protein
VLGRNQHDVETQTFEFSALVIGATAGLHRNGRLWILL